MVRMCEVQGSTAVHPTPSNKSAEIHQVLKLRLALYMFSGALKSSSSVCCMSIEGVCEANNSIILAVEANAACKINRTFPMSSQSMQVPIIQLVSASVDYSPGNLPWAVLPGTLVVLHGSTGSKHNNPYIPKLPSCPPT